MYLTKPVASVIEQHSDRPFVTSWRMSHARPQSPAPLRIRTLNPYLYIDADVHTEMVVVRLACTHGY